LTNPIGGAGGVREISAHDVVALLADGKSFSNVANELQINRQRIAALVQRAFREGIVHLQDDPRDKDLMAQLTAKFPSVESCVIEPSHQFARLAALQILTWIKDCVGNSPHPNRPPYVAIGGGKTLERIAGFVGPVLADAKHAELREYFTRCGIIFVNATAGGLADNPTCESSHVACVFGQNATNLVNIFSLSSDPSPDEKRVVENAVKNTCVIVSGIGDSGAYCAQTMAEKLRSRSALDGMVGEFLFYCYDKNGMRIPGSEDGLAVKEDTVGAGGASAKNPMLATLCRFESLKSRENRSEEQFKYKIAVAQSPEKPDECVTKATAISVLARNLYLTHLCVSADLARSILKLRL
jgi:hypothetical protein